MSLGSPGMSSIPKLSRPAQDLKCWSLLSIPTVELLDCSVRVIYSFCSVFVAVLIPATTLVFLPPLPSLSRMVLGDACLSG